MYGEQIKTTNKIFFNQYLQLNVSQKSNIDVTEFKKN